ncbi:hypothetical protein K474DRAFT_1614167 [Panus rudis PR-1116 ss-1]|nr:hypothetical protein K474DRAFT_1614167 [Panus rudis PR-1116 ss-1]
MSSAVSQQLEEINLLKCSLMQGEQLVFDLSSEDAVRWESLLTSYPEHTPVDDEHLPCARFQVRVEGSRVWFDVEIPKDYPEKSCAMSAMISVRGDTITRQEQEHWRNVIAECATELTDSERYPLYELISTYLLPRLHEENEAQKEDEVNTSPSQRFSSDTRPSQRYHALLTSHHLISPTKRRNMQHWTSQLGLRGFAKVGYPGVIYCEGDQPQVEEFVGNVKAMQWLALKVRFVEPLSEELQKIAQSDDRGGKSRWVEFEKVGEVVEEMRRLGRDSYIVEMGIGSAGTKVDSK